MERGSRAYDKLASEKALAKAVAGHYDLRGIMRVIRDIFVEHCGFDRVGVYSFDPVTETMRGSWGTDTQGALEDNSHIQFPFSDPERGAWEKMQAGGHGFFVRHYAPNQERTGLPEEMQTVVDHAAVILAAGGELVGYVAVDNLLTNRPITEGMVSKLTTFAQHAALAVQNAKLREDREAATRLQRRVTEISLAITSNENPEMVYLLVRNAILEIGFVDRASVWIADENAAYGTWGTDERGELIDEHHLTFPLNRRSNDFSNFGDLDHPFVINEVTVEGPNGDRWEGIPHAHIPLLIGGQFIGFVAVDTLWTRRKITSAMISAVLPITDQAAVAVQKSRLLAQREAVVAQQKRLMEIGAAITSSDDPDSVFRMVRDAVLESGAVDRVGVWLVDGDTALGTWGTYFDGQPTEEHDFSFSLESLGKEYAARLKGDSPFVITDPFILTLPNGEVRRDIPGAIVPLRAHRRLIGILTVDMLLTMREITPAVLEIILPLAEQAAVAIQNSHLLTEARQEIDRRTAVEAMLIGQTHELIAARDDALAGARAKSEFLANMSHEIRTPMNGVLGMISLLMMTPLTEKQHNYANGVQKSAEALLSVIDDILDLSRLEAGMLKIDCSPFDLRQCITDVTEMMAPQITTKPVELKRDIPQGFPDLLLGDYGRVRQMITNLLANAVKFTDKGEVVIEAACLSETSTNATVRITVRDTGIGIADDRQAAVFESFTQADWALTRRYGGSGLGLTITKQMVELMDGSIHLKSRIGEGTTVWLDIPFAKQTQDSASAKAGPLDQDGPLDLRVLLAEDNSINAFLAIDRLEQWGCVCVGVGNGLEALKALASQKFDLVLMDMSMPVMDGIQAIQELRRSEQTTGLHLPVIAMTAHAMRGDRERCLAAGMDDYVSKPVNFHELRKKLQFWTGA